MPKRPVPSSKLAIVNSTLKLTVSRLDAARALGVDIQTVDRLIAAKKLKASKIGRRVLIRLDALETMLEQHAIT